MRKITKEELRDLITPFKADQLWAARVENRVYVGEEPPSNSEATTYFCKNADLDIVVDFLNKSS